MPGWRVSFDTSRPTEARPPQPHLVARPRPNPLPYLAILVGVLATGFSALFVRWAAAPGPVTGFYRMGLASLALAPFALVRRGGRQVWPRLGLLMAALGGLSLALDLSLWNTSVNMTRAANATLLGNTAPLWVALGAWLLFRERLTGRFWLGLGFTLAGAAAVAGADFLLNLQFGWGDLLGLGAGLFYAGYYLCTQRGREHLDPLQYVWAAGTVSAVMLLAISTALRLPLTGYPVQSYMAFLGAALVTQVLGYVSVAYALGHLPASVVSPSMVGQPLVTAMLGIPLLGEWLSPVQWLGGAAVLLGILLVHRSHTPVA